MPKSLKYYLREKATAMAPGEWTKPNGKTGEFRLAILRDLGKKGEEIELVDGRKAKITDTETLFANIAQFETDGKTFEIPTKQGVIKSNQVAKSAVFGGGGGAGGGTDQTAIAEPQTCVYIHAMLDNGVNSPDFYRENKDILKKAFAKGDYGKTTFEQILTLVDDDGWHQSAWLSAKVLIDGGYVQKGMKFHRDSAEMKAIYKAKNEAFKNSGMKPFSDDKWNPGDVWAIAKGFKASDLDTSSIDALNKDLLGLYTNRKIVGISLKKVGKKAQVVPENIKQPPETDSYKVTAYRLKGKSRGTIWTNKSGSIEFDNTGVIGIKANKYMGSHKMELEGKGARGGGAGWQIITNSAKKNLKKRIPATGNIKKMAQRIVKGDKRAVAMFHGMLNEIEGITLAEVEEQLKNKKTLGDPGWVMAKLAATYIIYYVAKNKGAKANGFITDIVNYAGSKTAEGGPYIIVKA